MKNGLFEITQNIVLRNNEDKVLVLNKGDKYLLPGGRIQENESWEDALKREVCEETGIVDFKIDKIIEIASSDDNTKIILTFAGSVGEVSVRLSEEHETFAWVKKEELDNYNFWHPSIKARILKAFEK